MSKVSISRCESYEPAAVSAALDVALAPLGGMAAFVSPGQTVLLKINLLSRAAPERAVTTHPEFVRAVIRAAKAAGGVVTVGDSPGGVNSAGSMNSGRTISGMMASCGTLLVLLVTAHSTPACLHKFCAAPRYSSAC